MSSRVGGDEVGRLEIETVVESEYASMLAIGLALLRDSDDAAELAQETMLRLRTHWDSVGGFDRPGAWCRRVALNVATDMLRDRQRRRRLSERLATAAAAAPDGASDQYWDERFWAQVGSLPERSRNVVVLHYVHDLSVETISETLEIPLGTVKSDLSRARARLRSAMEEGP